MDLLREITRCQFVKDCYANRQDHHGCLKVISAQSVYHSRTLDNHQVPEPWSGDIEHAPILFLSSNPAIDEKEEFPLWSWPDEWIKDFFKKRYGDGRKQWIQNGTHNLLIDGSRGGPVRFWSFVRNRAKELLERDVKDGVDYALTEVVHCKSESEKGVKEALSTCTNLYLEPVLNLSGAKVIVVLGDHAKKAVKGKFEKELKNALKLSDVDELKLSDGDTFGPIHICGHQRYIVFLPHSNARKKRTFKACINDEETIQKLRAYLRCG